MAEQYTPAPGIQATFAEAEALGAHVYVLAAPLHNGSLPGALSVRRDHVACMLDGGADVQAVSPHLIYIPPSHFESARAWLEQHGPASPCATILASPLPLAGLAEHLKTFLRVRLPDGEPIVLAYWDPAILATLVGSAGDEMLFVKGPVLSDAQCQAWLAPVLRWTYWDRKGALRQIDWRQDRMPASAAMLKPPFKLDQGQVDALIEASVPDGLLLHLMERDPSTLAEIPEGERYGFVCRQIERARQHGIADYGSWFTYCMLAVRHGEGFDEIPEGTVLLMSLLSTADTSVEA
ncbi:Uncharacterised protein [Burkholderia pseudomallei]|uniref:DUF4123 domain-containing protein n=1 Tax=Burkholderia pseudomallei TaxID=28450 RepID=UPI0001722AEE|nr:DUF4123 domain-containing protein [Burkholderia pseudomallei]EDS84582.1 hypothetical protein BURPSS13_H0034 [Burkholderia pseudomallei S13]MBF3633000.1 DUF4123 domain-containing protein [Burkholderia pseudomallei]MBF3873890.1 DUF4123 domain-containing protein [Burkholderia pseudomallei]MBF3906982.1 DUF4123 domain-containing protein [Burkholderia pseudomallei]MBY7652497.1 DUF4123 domain-containing protein [Burkholderia pseudomallei]